VKTLVTNYTCSPSTKQLTLTDYPSIKLDQILLITNVTDNIIVYNFADPTAGGTLASNILTLGYNTTTMSDTDRLQIFIDDYVIPSTEASLTAVQIRIDNTNTLLNVLTAKETTISLDVSAINLNTDQVEQKLDSVINNQVSLNGSLNGNIVPGIQALVADLDEIRVNTEFGTTSDAPLFVNPGTLTDTDDSVSIDASISQTATTALTSKVYIAGSRKVYNVFGITTAGIDQYIQLYNTTSQTPSGTLIGVFYIPANSNFSFDLNRGLNFTNNILVVNSITPVVYTPGNDDLFVTVIHN